MEQILKDKQLNSAYHNKGFVKFPLFDAMQISEIKEFYNYIREKHNAKKNNAFHTTLNTSDSNIINKVNDFLIPYYKKEINKYLINYNLTISVFLTKDRGKNSSVTIHQDGSFVDETKHTAFGLWVALDNTNVLNGCMQFIPGSHKFYPSLRISPDLPPYFYSFKDAAVDYLVDVPSKAGECVMFNQAIIHASRKNFSNKQRVACITGGYSKNAEFTHHFLPKGNPLSKIEKYKISVKSMLEMKKDERPKHAEFLGYIDYKAPDVSFEVFKDKCELNVGTLYKYRNRIINKLIGKSS